jgi:hypothetical protein
LRASFLTVCEPADVCDGAVRGPFLESEKSSLKEATPLSASIWMALPIRGPSPDNS